MFHKKTFHFTTTVSHRALLATEILEQSMPQLPQAACHPTRKLIDLFDIAMEHILASTPHQGGLEFQNHSVGYLYQPDRRSPVRQCLHDYSTPQISRQKPKLIPVSSPIKLALGIIRHMNEHSVLANSKYIENTKWRHTDLGKLP